MKDGLDLAQLADTYDILGELAGRDDARVVMATRKADGRPVLIAAQREPAGDEGNALSHLASDARLLADDPHPAVVPVLESRWLDNNVLATVTDRVADLSLEDRLLRRDEAFPYARIAAVLREINAALDWARERGVVHRAVALDRLFLEDGSDRVRITFSVRPLEANGIPDERDDARVVAALARAMLTRSAADPDRDRLPLAELRPGLPSQVVQQTEVLLGRADSLEPVDVRSYIASIAMADELKRGEDERERVTAEMSEEQRVTRDQLAAERTAHEEDLAEQARRFAKERDEILATMAAEREQAARALAKEQETGQRELAEQRQRLEKEIRKAQTQLERERARLDRERKAFDREREKGREQIAARLAAIRDHAELYARTSELPAVLTAPLPELAEPLPEPESELPPITDEIVDEPEDIPAPALGDAEARAPSQPPSGPPMPRHAAWGRAWPRRVGNRRVGMIAAGMVLVIVAVALAIGRRSSSPQSAVQPAPVADAQFRVLDSLAGVVVSEPESLPGPVSSSGPSGTSGSERTQPAQSAPASEVPAVATQDTVPVITYPFATTWQPLMPITRRDSMPPADSALRRDSVPRDTVMPRDTLAPPRDTIVRPADTSR